MKGLGGDVSVFFSDPILDTPHDVVVAVNAALTVLSWFENLPEDEQPPRTIWWSEDLLEEWFKDVKERRDRKYGGGRSRSSYDDADDAPMVSNELADQFRP